MLSAGRRRPFNPSFKLLKNYAENIFTICNKKSKETITAQIKCTTLKRKKIIIAPVDEFPVPDITNIRIFLKSMFKSGCTTKKKGGKEKKDERNLTHAVHV